MSVPFIETFQEVLKKIESAQIPYMIVGSVASMVYGEPRLTRDMDLVLDIKVHDAKKFADLFTQPEYYCPPIEILTDEILNRGQFNLLHVSSGLKVDIMVKKKTSFDDVRFARRQKISLWQDLLVFIATPEDVILKKLDFYKEGGSEKHVQDIRGILANTEVDRNYIEDWVNKLNLTEEWEKIL